MGQLLWRAWSTKSGTAVARIWWWRSWGCSPGVEPFLHKTHGHRVCETGARFAPAPGGRFAQHVGSSGERSSVLHFSQRYFNNNGWCGGLFMFILGRFSTKQKKIIQPYQLSPQKKKKFFMFRFFWISKPHLTKSVTSQWSMGMKGSKASKALWF